MAICSGCGIENRADAKFCGECGSGLASPCAACGSPNEATRKFCGECGAPLSGARPAAASPAPGDRGSSVAAPPAPVAERRLVSVLFVDLVGFTSASEARDAEETRELLSHYFELARTLVDRYGGVIEKFIGDAVMAVWGTPTATEDDAERAVRAALELVGSVPNLDETMRARAGVLTGEAAVTLGAQGQGMVAGDLVNTASRVQSAAEPGAVFVGEATRRASEQAVVYEAAGEHMMKGKAEPVALWRALRIVSGVGGSLKSVGLESPFFGRDHELRLIKELFHGCITERRAHLVSVAGIAGVGKSRLGWEFYKYVDGLVDGVWWHRGRCLAYGESVTYRALADMIRMRCRIAEDEQPGPARAKLATTLTEHLLDPDEQEFVEPRVAQLLGLEEGGGARQELFAAWRLFLERMASSNPVVLAFEDVQWADGALLDFVEYLLESSRDHPLFVITFARPELHERRPGWGAKQRNFSALYLEPLAPGAMEDVLDGLAPGLPEALQEQILARAQGIPLYAMETVRMLLDRGLLARDGLIYAPTQRIDTLEVPESLHALIAARLDGCAPEERQLLQDGAVLGKTFTSRALAAISGRPEAEVEACLAGLVRKEVLGVQSDPRSPEHGQYGFLQDLVRHVAYRTLSKRDRKRLHLAAAAYLETVFGDGDDVAEVLAAHYLAANDAAVEAADAEAIRAKAGAMLARAGERAGSLGAPEEAQRYYDQAAALAEGPLVRARLLEKAGGFAVLADHWTEGRDRLEPAIALYTEAGEQHAAARASASLADIDRGQGRMAEGKARLAQAVRALEQDEASGELATALAALGRLCSLLGHHEEAMPVIERALALAEWLALTDVFVDALTTKAGLLGRQGRLKESRMVHREAVELARAGQLHASELRASNNLCVVYQSLDRFADGVALLENALPVARRSGDRRYESVLDAGRITPLFFLGRWDEALAIAAEDRGSWASEHARGETVFAALVHTERGEIDAATALVAAAEPQAESLGPQYGAGYAWVAARVLRARGRPAEALAAARGALAYLDDKTLPVTDMNVRAALVEAIEAALAVPDLATAAELLAIPASVSPGLLMPLLHAAGLRLGARLDAARGQFDPADDRFAIATAICREFALDFHAAVTQLEHAEWLALQQRDAEAQILLGEARDTFERLGAGPWLTRTAHAARGRAATTAS